MITCQTGDVRFEFIADRPVLDYLSTIAERGTSDEEKLESEQDLADWIVQSGIVDTAPPVTQQTLERGKALREAMFRLVATLINHQNASATDRALVNAAAEFPPPLLRLEDDRLHRYGDIDAVFAVLARDCLDLFDSPDRAALRWCADATCSISVSHRAHCSARSSRRLAKRSSKVSSPIAMPPWPGSKATIRRDATLQRSGSGCRLFAPQRFDHR